MCADIHSIGARALKTSQYGTSTTVCTLTRPSNHFIDFPSFPLAVVDINLAVDLAAACGKNYVIVDGLVHDVSKFLGNHPGMHSMGTRHVVMA